MTIIPDQLLGVKRKTLGQCVAKQRAEPKQAGLDYREVTKIIFENCPGQYQKTATDTETEQCNADYHIGEIMPLD